jgi:hypothetical protein
MQWRCKHAFATKETVFSAWSMQSGYKEELRRTASNFEKPAWRDMNLGAEELSWQLQNNGKKGIRL